jgi:hypothetical protein
VDRSWNVGTVIYIVRKLVLRNRDGLLSAVWGGLVDLESSCASKTWVIFSEAI